MDKMIHTPEGVRDVFSEECKRKRMLEQKIEKVFQAYGYQEIETPTFEFFDVFGREVGTTPSRELYKFFDREGNTLVLRPDFTPSIARAVSMYYMEEDLPIRLWYQGSSFVNNSSYQGRLKESTQMGVELLNEDSPMADAELLAMTVRLMLDAGFREFQVSVGHVGYFRALAKEARLSEEGFHQLRELISIKNYFGVEELLERFHLHPDQSRALAGMTQMFGGPEVLQKARILTRNREALEAVERLEAIYEILKDYGYEKYICFDFGMLSRFQYYTGIIFQAYTYGNGEPLVKGGRYDRLLNYFGKNAPAVGFCAMLQPMLDALERQKISTRVPRTRTMLLYPDFLEKMAVQMAKGHRKEGLDVALVPFGRGRVLDDYIAYGKRNQFGGIVYIQKETAVFAIDLTEPEVHPVEITQQVQKGGQA